jgi:hypothetical protein
MLSGSAARVAAVLVCLAGLVLDPGSANAEPAQAIAIVDTPGGIVLGFVGGFVRHDDRNHPEVQLAERLRQAYGETVAVHVFENRRRREARRVIAGLLDKDRDGRLSLEEKNSARIILFGHSWGAAAAIALARELQREKVPVLLTVQIDSIRKIGQNDAIIPDNVSRAVNFYQKRGIFHGQAMITAANPSRTQVLGNVLLDYNSKSLQCRNVPWYDRFFFREHIKIECDQEVWSKVEALIKEELKSTTQQRPIPSM